MKLSNTPWGNPQTQMEIAPGIISVDTASHGGYWLSKERFAEFRAMLPKSKLWAGDQWFEEDSDWRLVVLCFPRFFSEFQVRNAATATMKNARWKAKAAQTRESV